MRDTLGTRDVGAWSGGVVKATDAANLPINASPRGLNCALALARTGVPFVQKREGVRCLTPTPLTGSEALIGQHDYVQVSTGTRRHLVSTETRLAVKETDGTYSVLSTAVTSATPPDFATANSMAFFVNGTDQLKVRGTTVEKFGIVRPTVGTMAGASGVAGLHNGTYELRVAFRNSATGHTSSASDTAAATVTCTNDVIDWSDVPVSADPQVDTRVLLVRNIGTQPYFYEAGTIADNTTTTAQTSVLDANLLTLAPKLTTNDPPPTTAKYITVYLGRVVVADDEGIYWSEIDKPEQFNLLSFDGIDSSGDPITGLFVDQDTLLVFKDDRLFAISGDLGGAYTIRLIDADMGCVAHRTIVSAGGQTYWWSRHGIARFNGISVDRVGLDTLGPPDDLINTTSIAVSSAIAHDERSAIYFAVPGSGQERASGLVAFNYALGVIESEWWDPMDVASLGQAVDGTGVLQPTLGGYAGQVFRLWDTNNDGVASGTTASGTFTASGASITALSDPLATFDTTGGGLIERRLTIVDSAGEIVTSSPRPRITANTATGLTFTPAVALTAGATYTYIVGGPNFQFDTPWRDFNDPFLKKRFEFLHILVKGASFGAAASLEISFNHNNAGTGSAPRTFTAADSSGVWDTALWDVDVWDTPDAVAQRYRVARVGRNWRLRIINANANEPFALLYVAMQAAGQTHKR